MLKQYHLKDYHFRLVIYVLALTILGIMVIGSAKSSVQKTQILGMLLGLTIMTIVSLMDYSFILRFSWLFYFLNIALLVLVKVMGDDANGATRWVTIAGIRFQPSELSKIIIILFFAYFFMKNQENLNTIGILISAIVLIAIPLLLILKQPDLSTTIVTALIFVSLLFIAGLSYKIVLGVLAVSVPAVIIFLSLILQPNQKILDDYQYRRIMAWLNPKKYADDAYQQQNSIMAIGSGKLWGKGLNNDNIASVKNGNFISEPQTDFIFAVAGEELGFVGAAAIIILLFLIVFECILIARKAKDLSGRLIACGVASLIGFQGFVNICVVTGLMPNTGLPLPFVSYGLTSLITLYIGIGLVLNVGLQPKKY
ncbi:MAG: FtsW/RodA/SpoVE family cell cycle protein [Lachnospiraceae bacterium]|uniref:FtsW/RodA/SpoVE family cell cycle protein n=1 Tax=Roseburia hominis TaxID=301301 RepID=UPI001F1B2A7D|nr:rod shape-determining protein RodA [Roseburia hominis]MCI5713080.1 rod shape-determining protein RodA [Lachnospiraceae bacterium]MDD6169575.1 FtsW/RodA/SpoVE family cell cycle protein [Lachnospiraceae bacterium]MDY4839199.1 FtsW/RodA/SpoVE family cell cycle protein [Lachnospiraceae bacterium]